MKDRMKHNGRIENDPEGFLREHSYSENLTGFDAFWEKYKKTGQVVEEKPAGVKLFSMRNLIVACVLVIGIGLLGGFPLYRYYELASGNAWLVSIATGDVFVTKTGSAIKQHILREDVVRKGDIIKTGLASRCKLKLENKDTCSIEPDSEMKLTSLLDGSGNMGVEIGLVNGSINLDLVPIRPGESFKVTTSCAIASVVVYTKFSIRSDDRGDTRIIVSEGNAGLSPILTALFDAKANRKIDDSAFNALSNEFSNPLIVNAGETCFLKKSSVDDLNASLGAAIGNSRESSPETISSETLLKKSDLFEKSEKLHSLLFIKETKTVEEKPLASKGSGTAHEGTLVWKTGHDFSRLEKEILVYRNTIAVPLGNEICFFSEKDGLLLKSFKAEENGFVFTKASADGNVIFAGSNRGGIYSFSPAGNRILNKMEAGRMWFNAAPVSRAGIIAAPSMDDGIRIYAKDGSLQDSISLPAGDAVYSEPVLLHDGGAIVFATEKGIVTAHDIRNKKDIWSTTVSSGRIVYPVVGDESTVFVLSRESGTVTALQAGTGKILWAKIIPELMKTLFNPVFNQGRILLSANVSDGSIFFIIDGMSGEVSQFTLDEKSVEPLLTPDSIFIATKRGQIIRRNIKTGKQDIFYSENQDWVMMAIVAAEYVYAISSRNLLKLKL
jgi:hypothetical protein